MNENLTPREQEILDLLLDGTVPKEIAYNLKISYDTVIGHQRNLYRKLGVQSIQELLVKFAHRTSDDNTNGDAPASAKTKHKYLRLKFLFSAAGIALLAVFSLLLIRHFIINSYAANPLVEEGVTAPIFNVWNTFCDAGSLVKARIRVEKIEGRHLSTHTFSGTRSADTLSYAGVLAIPDPAGHEAMKTMTSFSFAFLGDGNAYEVMLTTSDTHTIGEQNHYRKIFNTVKGKKSTLTVNISELEQSTYFDRIRFGQPVDFIQENVECFQFQPYNFGDFKLKVWDIRFHQ